MSETHFTKGQKFELPDYKPYHNPFSDVLCRQPCGGVSAFIHTSVQEYVEHVETNYTNHVIITLKGGHRIFGSYIPPSESIYFSEECIWDIPFFFTPKDSDRVILGGGDLNSRMGDLTSQTSCTYRKNPDNETNTNGRTLKKICSRYNIQTLNNLSIYGKDFDGDFTYHKDDRKSQVDVCLSNNRALDSVTAFRIHTIPFNFSDHLPISTELEIDINSSISMSHITADILSNNGDDAGTRPPKIPTNINWNAYINTASKDLQEMKRKIENTAEYTQDTVDKIVDDLHDIISKSAHAHKEEDKSEDIVLEVHEGNRTVEKISNDISSKEIKSWNDILNNKNPKELWNKINWKDSTSQSTMKYPSAEALGEHFQQKSMINDEVPFAFANSNHEPILDDPISDAEITKASRRLKEDKSTADGMSPKHITSVAGVLFTILSILMNVILRCSIYPTQWRTTIVSAIFKNKESSLFPKFYRPIS